MNVSLPSVCLIKTVGSGQCRESDDDHEKPFKCQMLCCNIYQSITKPNLSMLTFSHQSINAVCGYLNQARCCQASCRDTISKLIKDKGRNPARDPKASKPNLLRDMKPVLINMMIHTFQAFRQFSSTNLQQWDRKFGSAQLDFWRQLKNRFFSGLDQVFE